ncbi:MAG TPA: hypothetical protein DDY31_09920 [Lachnospiraceae bacterium]|nr:hypothetical protein [Lachnospiraceae bacterium]
MGLFKKKVKEEPVKSLKAFVSGKVISITEVNDQVFSSKTLGEGVAIQPAGYADERGKKQLTKAILNDKILPINSHEGVASVYRSKSTY